MRHAKVRHAIVSVATPLTTRVLMMAGADDAVEVLRARGRHDHALMPPAARGLTRALRGAHEGDFGTMAADACSPGRQDADDVVERQRGGAHAASIYRTRQGRRYLRDAPPATPTARRAAGQDVSVTRCAVIRLHRRDIY